MGECKLCVGRRPEICYGESVDLVWGSGLKYVMGESRLCVGLRLEICYGREQTLCGAQT